MRLRSEILDILNDLTTCDGIIGSAVFSRDGVLINHCGFLKKDLLPSIMAMMVKCADKSIKLLKGGEIDYILIKSEYGIVLSQSCPNFILSVITTPETDISPVLDEMKVARKRIRGIL